jgi:hypothetical protein
VVDKSVLSSGEIAGIAVGAAAFIVCCALLLVFLWCVLRAPPGRSSSLREVNPYYAPPRAAGGVVMVERQYATTAGYAANVPSDLYAAADPVYSANQTPAKAQSGYSHGGYSRGGDAVQSLY